ESTFSSLPASGVSFSEVAYFRTALDGRTVNNLRLLSLVVNVSAIPTPRYSSSALSAPNDLNGSTAIDLMAGPAGCSCFLEKRKYQKATTTTVSVRAAIKTACFGFCLKIP